jgi:hypothetical protein
MNNWKIHFCWLTILGILLLISIITFWLGGKGNEIVSYISFASALISIILALVAIFYSMIQHTSSQQNIGEMRTLVSEASRIITEKATSIERQTLLVSGAAQLLIQRIGPTLPRNESTFYLDVSGCSHIGLLGLYALAKSEEYKKSLVLLELLKRFIPETNMQFVIHNYIMGLFIGFGCFLTSGSITLDLVNVTANKLPPGFKDYIVRHIETRIEALPSEMKGLLQNSRREIDAYFQVV